MGAVPRLYSVCLLLRGQRINGEEQPFRHTRENPYDKCIILSTQKTNGTAESSVSLSPGEKKTSLTSNSDTLEVYFRLKHIKYLYTSNKVDDLPGHCAKKGTCFRSGNSECSVIFLQVSF